MLEKDDFDSTRKVRPPADEGDEGTLFGGSHLTVLTFGILGVVLVMLLFIAHQSITTERVFFRKMSLRTNQKIADLISQQFAQVFSNTTGLVEDMAQFPTVASMRRESVDYMFEMILKRHGIFRALYVVPFGAAGGTPPTSSAAPTPETTAGDALARGAAWEWFNTNVNSYRAVEESVVRELAKGWVPSRLTDYYPMDGMPAISYVCGIRDRRADRVVGLLAGEINLDFIQRVIDSAELGRTGDVLVVDKRGQIIFSTSGFTDVEDFNKNFPVEEAYENKKGGIEYEGVRPKLAAYTRIRELTTRQLLPGLFRVPLTDSVTPREIPDWLIVVLQDSAEGYLAADRLKWNIIILLVVGAVGVFIIGKLWMDSVA